MTTSALNAIQRTGGAAGTAMLAIILQRTIAADLPGLHADAQAIAGLTTRQRAQADRRGSPRGSARRPPPRSPPRSGTTFWIALALIALTLFPVLLLPRNSTAAASHAPDEPEAPSYRKEVSND